MIRVLSRIKKSWKSSNFHWKTYILNVSIFELQKFRLAYSNFKIAILKWDISSSWQEKCSKIRLFGNVSNSSSFFYNKFLYDWCNWVKLKRLLWTQICLIHVLRVSTLFDTIENSKFSAHVTLNKIKLPFFKIWIK